MQLWRYGLELRFVFEVSSSIFDESDYLLLFTFLNDNL